MKDPEERQKNEAAVGNWFSNLKPTVLKEASASKDAVEVKKAGTMLLGGTYEKAAKAAEERRAAAAPPKESAAIVDSVVVDPKTAAQQVLNPWPVTEQQLTKGAQVAAAQRALSTPALSKALQSGNFDMSTVSGILAGAQKAGQEIANSTLSAHQATRTFQQLRAGQSWNAATSGLSQADQAVLYGIMSDRAASQALPISAGQRRRSRSRRSTRSKRRSSRSRRSTRSKRRSSRRKSRKTSTRRRRRSVSRRRRR